MLFVVSFLHLLTLRNDPNVKNGLSYVGYEQPSQHTYHCYCYQDSHNLYRPSYNNIGDKQGHCYHYIYLEGNQDGELLLEAQQASKLVNYPYCYLLASIILAERIKIEKQQLFEDVLYSVEKQVEDELDDHVRDDPTQIVKQSTLQADIQQEWMDFAAFKIISLKDVREEVKVVSLHELEEGFQVSRELDVKEVEEFEELQHFDDGNEAGTACQKGDQFCEFETSLDIG